MRVALIPTGRMEWYGLCGALGRLFPGHTFYSLPTQREVDSNRDITFPIASFTSGDVTHIMHRENNNAQKMVERAAAEAIGDRRHEPADLVIMLDDLELANIDQAEVVVLTMRLAVERHLNRFSSNARRRDRTAEALRDKVSFHLAKPMIESWLFADPSGPSRAGVPQDRIWHLDNTVTDPEEFQTDDSDYEADTGACCACWNNLPERTGKQKKTKRKHRPQWLKAGADRNRHPKAYMCWLCRNGSEKSCTAYTETGGGATSLRELEWSALFADTQGARFARSLIEDIAWVLEAVPPYPGDVAQETSHTHVPQDRVLRNL